MGLGWLKIILSRYATKTYQFPPISPAYSYHCHHPRSHIETLTSATIYNEWSTVTIENGFLTVQQPSCFSYYINPLLPIPLESTMV